MAQIAKRYQDELPRLKKAVESAYNYFKHNYDDFHEKRRFIFDTSLSNDELNLLKELMKPQIECNTLEAFISRLLGEFAMQEPSVQVASAPGSQMDPLVIEYVEGHMRAILFDANNDSFEWEVYKESLSGGFSGMKVLTEYENEYSMEQCIRIGKPTDVTLTGFDPLARLPHKGDGRYYFELYPKTKEEFKQDYPHISIDDVSFSKSMAGFNWSYENNNEDVLLICDFYEKKKRPMKIYKLADGNVVTEDEYEEKQQQWQNAIQSGFTIMQPPAIVQERKSEKISICRYRFIETEILEYVDDTDFESLPGIFTDGNSALLRTDGTGALKQVTRSYIHHARDVQRMKNMAFQSLGNEIENLVQHKWVMPVEGIPQEYSGAYTNNQLPNVVLYNSFKDNDPEIPLQPPREVQRTPIPPEVTNTITLTDQLNQMVLGSFDSSLGINNNQLSGKAIIAAATQSNSAAMPYIVGFLKSLNQVAQIILELIPKYYKTPRTIPIIDREGKRSYVRINEPGTPNFNYKKNALEVRVEAGVNFTVQKQQSLQFMEQMMQASPLIAQFISQEGLDVVFDNMEFRGADILKSRAPQFMQSLKQQAAQAAQAQQNNPMFALKAQDLQIRQQQNQNDMLIKTAQVQNDAEALANERLKLAMEAKENNLDSLVTLQKAAAEIKKAELDAKVTVHDQQLKHGDQMHRHTKEAMELHHQLTQSQKTVGENNAM